MFLHHAVNIKIMMSSKLVQIVAEELSQPTSDCRRDEASLSSDLKYLRKNIVSLGEKDLNVLANRVGFAIVEQSEWGSGLRAEALQLLAEVILQGHVDQLDAAKLLRLMETSLNRVKQSLIGDENHGVDDEDSMQLQLFSTLLMSEIPTISSLSPNLIELLQIALESFFKDRGERMHRQGLLRALICSLMKTNHQERVVSLIKSIIDDLQENSLIKKLTMLCLIGDDLFLEGFSEAIFHHEPFWKIVCEGLTADTNESRKKSLYLLKRTVDFVINDCKKETSSSCKWFLFDKSTFPGQEKLWSDFFLVIETIDEKQVHIVKQILPRLEKLTFHTSSQPSRSHPLYLSWLFAIYRILFEHQNRAVAKWSIVFFLRTFRNIQTTDCDHNLMEFLTTAFLKGFNSSSKIFSGDNDILVEKSLQEFLVHWQQIQNPTYFWNGLLQGVLTMSWGPVPLFYLVKVFKAILCNDHQEEVSIQRSNLNNLIHFFEAYMTCQEPLLKCSVQGFLLEIALSCCKSEQVFDDFLGASAFLKNFHGPKKVLSSETKLWSKASNWLCIYKRILSGTFEDLLKHCQDNTEALALGIAVLAGDLQRLLDTHFMRSLLLDIMDGQNRPYDEQAVTKFMFLCNILNSFQPTRRRDGRSFLKYGAEPCSKINVSLASRLNTSGSSLISKALQLLPRLSYEDANQVLMLVVDVNAEAVSVIAAGVLKEYMNGASSDALKSLTMVSFALEAMPSSDCVIQALVGIKDWPSKLLTIDSLRTSSNACVSKYIARKWSILERSASYIPEHEVGNILAEAANAASVGGPEALEQVQKTMTSLLNNLYGKESILSGKSLHSLLNICLTMTFELRKSEMFWPCISAFIELLLCDALLQSRCEDVGEFQEAKVNILLKEAERVTGIAPLLAIRLKKASEAIGGLPTRFMNTLAALLSFGPLMRKDQKLMMQTNQMAVALGEDNAANYMEGSDHLANVITRASSLKIACDMIRKGNHSHRDLVQSIFLREDLVMDGKRRYYENSKIHLTKHRLLQSILILSPVLDLEAGRLVVNRLLRTILDEDSQLSVRYLMEWILSTLIKKHPELKRYLHESYEEARTSRIGCIPSFLFVLFDTCLNALEDDVRMTLDVMIPWTMSHQFASRFCAQTYTKRLYEHAVSKNVNLSQYEVVMRSIDGCFRIGDHEKNIEKINGDFFLSAFDTNTNFNIQDIFCDFTRICGLPREEWEHLNVYLHNLDSSMIPKENGQSKLGHFLSMKKEKELDICVEINDINEEGDVIQRKITPWKVMKDEMMLSDLSSAKGKNSRALPDLEVVASLIDRSPNLGGLCRTCEILGVGNYILSSRRLTEEKEFKNLSVTAENWQPILEVPRTEIGEFLTSRRLEGFTVIAVEQTSSSKDLHDFHFPEKTVLLLGNEREGIPVELLQLVDVCVEIPQSGLIRSFNVHVTGALVLWEYARQHRRKNK